MTELKNIILTTLVGVTLALGGACYAQTNSAVQELVSSDKVQGETIAVLKEKIDTLVQSVKEMRDDVKSIRNDIRDTQPR